MPEWAERAAVLRQVFGPGLRIDYAFEDDQVRGKPHAEARTMNADQWLHYVKTGEKPCSM
jgi:hypothetical protein